MSMEFGFFLGTVTSDEDSFHVLFNDRGDLRSGFTEMEPINLPDISSGNAMAALLGVNLPAIKHLNDTTNDSFSAFVGSSNQRYVRIAARMTELVTLKEFLPRVTDPKVQEFLRVFVENCERALDVGKERALLAIY